MDKKISVIVPIYNVEKYLKRAIKSIINQDYINLEIILVNDGSTDNSLEICNEFAKQDKRIFVINKKNSGVSDARNAGIDAATGEYISFIDSDDYAEHNMLSRMVEIIESNSADIVQCGYYIKNGNNTSERKNKSDIVIGKDKILESYFKENNINDLLWNKLYKAEVIKNVKMVSGKQNEDYMSIPEILLNANKVVIIDEPLYYYYQRQNSIMNDKFSMKTLDRLFAGKYVESYCENKCPNFVFYARLNLCYSCLYVYEKLIYSDRKKDLKIKKEILDEFKRVYKQIKWDKRFKENKKNVILRIFNINKLITIKTYRLLRRVKYKI